jgi:XTP/dITP diphosphohydrolase
MKIALASMNLNKCREIKNVAVPFGIQILSPQEIEMEMNLPPLGEVVESGETYHENAYLKARACHQWCGLPSIGDDSGLEVQILDGAPGIYSARYAGHGASDQDKVRKLISAVQEAEKVKEENRNACFRVVLCFINDLNSKETFFEATLNGYVLDTPRGQNGFGYDPIIDIPKIGGTLAELEPEAVYLKGFRAKAARKLFEFLKKQH